MDLQILPAPIAYVRHLVDVEDDNRAKFDQVRVLAQNTLQVVAAILVSDCLRLGRVGQLPTQPLAKKLAVGDFATFINETADILMPHVELSYVPELVQLYGERNKETRRRKDRLQRIVQNRNRDAHTASLAQSGTWLNELLPDVDAILEELDCLRAYTMVSTRNVELSPDHRSSRLNGLRCQGFSQRYVPIKLPISRIASRSEVILIKVDRSDWLSLRPWFLYFWNDNDGSRADIEELALLNAIDDRRLNFVGLISGDDYRVDSHWRLFTMYEVETSVAQPSIDTNLDIIDPEWGKIPKPPTEETDASRASSLLKLLTVSHENVAVTPRRGSDGEEFLVTVRTPVRDVAIATVDSLGMVQLFTRMLGRAVDEGLLEKTRFGRLLNELEAIAEKRASTNGALLDIGHISERLDWLGNLAHCFSN